MNPIDATLKTCFVIGPMATDADMTRQGRLANILRDAFKRLKRPDFKVVTPDIAKGGDIVEQVMGELDQAEIVVADLTGNNPSVLYELAIRHCTGLPCVHVRHQGKEGAQGALAFDVAHDRYVHIDLEANAVDPEKLDDMLTSAIKQSESTLGQSKNPVTAYFKVPLTDAYPASGVALGYCQNFVVRASEGIDAAKKKKITMTVKSLDQNAGVPLDLTADEWAKVKIAIWVPDSKDFVQPKYTDILKQTREFIDVTIPALDRQSRDISSLFHRETLQVVDIPTTLKPVATSIENYLGVDSAEAQKQIKREFARFGRALEFWKSRAIGSLKENDPANKGPLQLLQHGVQIEPLPEKYKIA